MQQEKRQRNESSVSDNTGLFMKTFKTVTTIHYALDVNEAEENNILML